MEERSDEAGFEPTVCHHTPVFKTSTLNHSDTHPVGHTPRTATFVPRGSGIRTCMLQVMSLASYQLLYSASAVGGQGSFIRTVESGNDHFSQVALVCVKSLCAVASKCTAYFFMSSKKKEDMFEATSYQRSPMINHGHSLKG